jgi:hypothetical protein
MKVPRPARSAGATGLTRLGGSGYAPGPGIVPQFGGQELEGDPPAEGSLGVRLGAPVETGMTERGESPRRERSSEPLVPESCDEAER